MAKNDYGRMKYILTIKPAILPTERHEIEDALEKLGYCVQKGRTDSDGSACDIFFHGKRGRG